MMRPRAAPMFLTPWATPGGMRTRREAPSPMGRRRTTFSVGEPARTSTRTSSILSLGGMNHTSVWRRCRWNALMAPGSISVVDLFHFEARQGRVHARAEPAQLREVAPIVAEALELDDIHTLDLRLGDVVLDRERALRLVVQAHGATPRRPIGSSISLPIIAVLTTP